MAVGFTGTIWYGYYGIYYTEAEYKADQERHKAESSVAIADQPRAIVTRQFADAEGFARNYMDIVNNYISSIGTTTANLEIPESDDPTSDVDLGEITPIDYALIPSFSPFTGTLEAIIKTTPVLGVFKDVPDIETTSITVEDVTFTEQTIPQPAFKEFTAPGDVQTNTVILPDKVDVPLPAEPTFADLAMPDFPIMSTREFDLVSPALPDNLTEPANLSYTEGVYVSDIRVTLFQKILADIANGGTGLSVDVEQDIYDRGQERQRIENERLYAETVSNFSGTGWELPTGVFASAIAEIQKEISRKNDQNNREITISQADLEQKNVQFAVAQATQIETALMGFFDNQSNRALDAAKTTASLGVEILNSLIAKYNARLKKYDSEAAALAEWIKFDAVKADNYKTQMSGVQIAAGVQETKAGIYEKQLKAVEIIKSMYQIDMEGARIQSEIERDKLIQLKTKTDIYLANLSGEKTKADIYLTMNDAEKTRAGIAAEKVRANGLRLEAAKSKSLIEAQQADNILKQNQFTLDKYRMDLEKIRTDIADELKGSELNVRGYEVEATTYNAHLRAIEAAFSTKIKEIDNQIQESRFKLEKSVATTKATVDGYLALKELKLKGDEGIMNVAAQIAASSMAGINVSASISDSTSRRSTQTWTDEVLLP